MTQLFDELNKLKNSDMIPLHMPGHKRSEAAGEMSQYYGIDITEIDDFDNLHDAEGIILEAEKRANLLYGAEETHFLINGSTCGVLAAVSACVEKGGKIIASRNCHKSFYHAAYLRELEMAFLYPTETVIEKKGKDAKTDSDINEVNKLRKSSIPGKIDAADVRKLCEENPDAQAVFITSPTYEGIPSDIKAIADITHEYGMVLIVDGAHGAHFGLSEKLPKSAITQGADVVIHSVHKTLAAMTQTALIHVQGDRVNREKLRRFLRIYQSSSPSYVLMSSIDSCINDIKTRGNEIFDRVCDYRDRIEKGTSECRHIIIPGRETIADPCKVLICSNTENITGQRIYDILRIEHNIQLEMAGDFYGLAIITGYDSDENIDRLISALHAIDEQIEGEQAEAVAAGNILHRKSAPKPERVLPFHAAWDGENEVVDITRASGRIAGDFINLYPPGIPLIIPGERFSKELVEQISLYINTERNVQGVEITGNLERRVKVLKA